jgi:hypothetical protein
MTSKGIILILSIMISFGLGVAAPSFEIHAQSNQTASLNTVTPTSTVSLTDTNQTRQQDNQSLDQSNVVNITEFVELANNAVSKISENNTQQAQQIVSEVEQSLNSTTQR